MKSGFKYLLVLSILFSACYENEVILPEIEVDLKQQAGESSLVMSNLLADMMKAVSLASEIGFDSEERIAEVRSGCPTTFLQSDGIYPDTFFINFDNCNASAVFNQRIDGGLRFILNGALDDPNICPLFSIKESPANPDFIIKPDETNRAYGVDILNEIDFCLQSIEDGRLKYNYTLDGGINLSVGTAGTRISGAGISSVLDIGGTTCYPSGMQGCVVLKENNKDDTTKPSTFVDNTYCVSSKPTIIECKFQDGSIERFCVATNPEGISYNLRCGCPQSGKLYINSPANGDCNNILSTSSFWDYSFIQNPGVGSCENSALDPDNIVARIPCGQSF